MSKASSNLTLVATLGPASFDKAQDLVEAGATAFRLNGSHMESQQLGRAIARVRDELPNIPIVVDLQGAKMRLGTFESRAILKGQSFELATHSHNDNVVPLPHPEIFGAVAPGDTLSCDDDRVRLRVQRCESAGLLVTSLVDATLRPRKGVNVLEHPVHLQDLTDRDIAQLEVCRGIDHLSFACSFMRDGREADWIRSRLPGARVIGKIERSEAIDALPSLAQQVGELWVCRGDLGAQLGLVEMARWLADFCPRTLRVPTLIAGQVLEHLTHHPDPTRSEVCHLHDLLQRGYAGVVLSDETAIGLDPLRATEVAGELIRTLR